MLTANYTYNTDNGVKVSEFIIPDGYRWKDAAKARTAGFDPGALYKKNQKLSGGTGKVQGVTIHNTGDLPNVYDDGEQYTRATYPNENMGSARVHYYVDDTGAWQDLKAGTGMTPNDPAGSAEVGWHAADGSTADGGNMTTLAIEIIENESAEHDKIARDNGAKLAAWLLWKHGLPIAKLFTHSYWNAKRAGKTSSDMDEQCVTYVSGGAHYCPLYIFGSYNKATALANWKAFKATVKKYLDALNGVSIPSPAPQPEPTPSETIYRVQTGAYKIKANAEALAVKVKAAGFQTYIVLVGDLYKVQTGAFRVKKYAEAERDKLKAAGFNAFVTTKTGSAVQADATIKVGDLVQCNPGVKTYYNGVSMPEWVQSAKLYVRQIEDGGTVYLVSIYKTGNDYTGRVKANDVHKV